MPRLTFPKYTLAVVGVLVAAFLIYFPSYSRYRELKSESESLQKQLKDLQAQILALQHEKQLIQTDKNYLEQVIRKELGLVEPGEVVYEFAKKSQKQTQKTQAKPVVPPQGTSSEVPQSSRPLNSAE